MSWIKPFRYACVLSLALLIIGILPYRPAIFISKDKYLLVTPQVCGCPCSDVRIKKGIINIPRHLRKKHDNIPTTEANLSNGDVINKQSACAENYNYYIQGNVVDLDTILCDVRECEVTPVIAVEKCYLAEYVPWFYATNDFVIMVAYILNLIVVLPAIIIIKSVSFVVNRKRKNKRG